MVSDVKVSRKKTRWVAYDEERVKKAARVSEAGGIVRLPNNGPWAELSLSSLWRDLDRERGWFLTGKGLRRSQQRGVHKKLKEIEITAKCLGKLLRDHDVFRFMVPRPQNEDDANHIVDARHVQDALEIIADLAAKGQAPLGFDHPLTKGFALHRCSAFEHLVGRLAGIYEKYSGKDVKFRRGVIGGYSQPLKGEFLSFALQALRELQITQSNGKPYSAEHTGRAYRRVKSGQPRQDRRRKNSDSPRLGHEFIDPQP